MNVLMPSAGKRYLHIRYIKEAKGVNKLVTTEVGSMAPAIHAADVCYRVPLIKSPDYLAAILRICAKEMIHLIIPLMDLDIVTFSRNRSRFEEKGIKILLHPQETIELSMDKLATFEFLSASGLPTPQTVSAEPGNLAFRSLPFPLIIKPKRADMKASADYIIQRIQTQDELEEIMKKIEGKEGQYVLQEYLTGTELTVDFFCNQEGRLISAVPGERLSALSKAFSKDGGAIDQGRTFHDPHIFQMVKRMAENTRFWGAANFQGYRDQQGKIKIVEINPRFSGATVMTKGAGHDFFQWSIDLAGGNEILFPEKDFEDVCMSSWLSPIFFKKAEILPTP
jgi:carbamoyl-phosphate synthase large subunit